MVTFGWCASFLLFFATFSLQGCEDEFSGCETGVLDITWQENLYQYCSSSFGVSQGMADTFGTPHEEILVFFNLKLQDRAALDDDEKVVGGLPPSSAVFFIRGTEERGYGSKHVILTMSDERGRYAHFPAIDGSSLSLDLLSFPEEVGGSVSASFKGNLLADNGDIAAIEGSFQARLTEISESDSSAANEGLERNPWITDPEAPPVRSGYLELP